MQRKFFANIISTNRITIHMLNDAPVRCRGSRMVWASEADMHKDGQRDSVNGRKIHVCRLCAARYAHARS